MSLDTVCRKLFDLADLSRPAIRLSEGEIWICGAQWLALPRIAA